jgi:lysozyme family protein
MDFEQAFQRVLGHEGGYVNDPRDPGGETKFGISKRAYPREDIAGMTVERARAIYLRDYWGPAGCDAVPDAAKLPLFDAAVNSGVRAAVRLLQRAVGEAPDGLLGPRTLLAAQSMPAPRLVARFAGQRLALMANLPTWPTYSRGWTLRVVDQLLEA